MSDPRSVTLNVNGEEITVVTSPFKLLIDVLRYDLGLTGTKRGCNQGVCGSCTVLMDGAPIRSCLCLIATAADAHVTTVEGLTDAGKPSVVQQAFLDAGAIQCGFCMPGLIISATALLNEQLKPTEDQIREAISGNLCRCSGYVKVIEAIHLAADRVQRPLSGAAE